jgi:hypothetical protein
MIAAPTTAKATLIDGKMLENALSYCSIDTDWYIRAEVSPSGRNIEAWLHWCVNRTELMQLIREDLACIDFAPSTWRSEESDGTKWCSIENVPENNEIPEDSLYFCRYLISEN